MTDARRRYPSDLTESQWLRLQEILPEPAKVGRHRTINLRDIANAINYRWETGCVWRMLPHDLPAWGTVYAYFRTWQRAGVIRQFRQILLEPRTKPAPRWRTHPSDHAPASARSLTTEPLHRLHPADDPGFSSPHDRYEPPPRTNPVSERAEM